MNGTHVKLIVFLLIILALSIRIWWVWPVDLGHPPGAEEFVKRGVDYSLKLAVESRPTDYVIDTKVFEGHDILNNGVVLPEDAITIYKSERENHSYNERIGLLGRIQYHREYHPNLGAKEWYEFLPNRLSIDDFFIEDIALQLNPTDNYTVYISNEYTREFLTVYVKERRIDRITWIIS